MIWWWFIKRKAYFSLYTYLSFQFYAILLQVKFFWNPWIASEKRNLKQKSKYMEFIFSHSHKSWPREWRKYINPRIGKYFFLLGEIFTTHFLRQTLSEQMGRGVPSDLVGIRKIILWFPALESNCILMATLVQWKLFELEKIQVSTGMEIDIQIQMQIQKGNEIIQIQIQEGNEIQLQNNFMIPCTWTTPEW